MTYDTYSVYVHAAAVGIMEEANRNGRSKVYANRRKCPVAFKSLPKDLRNIRTARRLCRVACDRRAHAGRSEQRSASVLRGEERTRTVTWVTGEACFEFSAGTCVHSCNNCAGLRSPCGFEALLPFCCDVGFGGAPCQRNPVGGSGRPVRFTLEIVCDIYNRNVNSK